MTYFFRYFVLRLLLYFTGAIDGTARAGNEENAKTL